MKSTPWAIVYCLQTVAVLKHTLSCMRLPVSSCITGGEWCCRRAQLRLLARRQAMPFSPSTTKSQLFSQGKSEFSFQLPTMEWSGFRSCDLVLSQMQWIWNSNKYLIHIFKSQEIGLAIEEPQHTLLLISFPNSKQFSFNIWSISTTLSYHLTFP